MIHGNVVARGDGERLEILTLSSWGGIKLPARACDEGCYAHAHTKTTNMNATFYSDGLGRRQRHGQGTSLGSRFAKVVIQGRAEHCHFLSR